MKKFILKTSIIFLFSLLLFRFTIVSLINDYEQKVAQFTTSSYLQEKKRELFDFIIKNNNKDKILDSKDAKILSTYIKKILKELELNQ
jgi:hypothetical protein